MNGIDNVVSAIVRSFARAEADAGACPQSWAAGARERLVLALRAYGLAVDSEVERIAALHWDGEWSSILRDAVIEARADRSERRVQAAINAVAAFDATCPRREI